MRERAINLASMEVMIILISMMIMPKASLGCSFSYFVFLFQFLDVWKIRICIWTRLDEFL